ncbi:MAG: hypothetical protein R2688_03525 [Fimbriimonadaceae bacterium]
MNIGIAGFLLMAINNSGLLGSAAAFAPPDPYPGTASHAVELRFLTTKKVWQKPKKRAKPVFLNFTGVTCGNCRVTVPIPQTKYMDELEKSARIELQTDRGTDEDNANADLLVKVYEHGNQPRLCDHERRWQPGKHERVSGVGDVR